MNLQHLLFLIAFITFGIGDALTAALMMSIKGHDAEFNVLFGYLYDSYGVICFIIIKLVLVIMVLFAAYILSRRGGYWLMNGWLIALSIGSVMAIGSNLLSTYDILYINPYHIIICYSVLASVFVFAGAHFDTKKRNVKNGQNR